VEGLRVQAGSLAVAHRAHLTDVEMRGELSIVRAGVAQTEDVGLNQCTDARRPARSRHDRLRQADAVNVHDIDTAQLLGKPVGIVVGTRSAARAPGSFKAIARGRTRVRSWLSACVTATLAVPPMPKESATIASSSAIVAPG
jgi:hypothetical protein